MLGHKQTQISNNFYVWFIGQISHNLATTRAQEISPFSMTGVGEMREYLVNSIIGGRSWHCRDAGTQTFSSLFLSSLPTSPRQHFICVSIDSWQQQCGSADCNKPVFWKQHSCLGSAIVTKWYGSEIGAMISVCALELRKSGTDETWNWNYFNNPGGEIIPSILVEDILECSLLEKGPFYPGCLETGI